MTGSLSDLLHDAGPLAFLNLAAAGVGLLLAIATLAAAKSNAARVLAVLCLLSVLGMLAVGFAGYSLGMVSTRAAFANVPDDMKDLMLRKGAEESRANFIFALAAALLPLLSGTLSAARTRVLPSLVLAGFAVTAFGATAAQLMAPLPPEGPLLAEPPGLQLPQSSSPRSLNVAALVALTPEGLWANGVRVPSLAAALQDPLVQERNVSTLPVLVDTRVTFSALADLLEAAQKAGRLSLQLVVLAPTGERHVIGIVGPAAEPPPTPGPPPLTLTVRVTETEFIIGATGATLPPLADAEALNAQLTEVKANFPDVTTIRMTAAPQVSLGIFVKALEAARARDTKVLFEQLVVGRFALPKGNESTP